MVCKAGKDLGLISSYKHAFGIQHALQALVLRPVITGIKWYTSFDTPDPNTGLVELASGATVRGGTLRSSPTGSTPVTNWCGSGTAGARSTPSANALHEL